MSRKQAHMVVRQHNGTPYNMVIRGGYRYYFVDKIKIPFYNYRRQTYRRYYDKKALFDAIDNEYTYNLLGIIPDNGK